MIPASLDDNKWLVRVKLCQAKTLYCNSMALFLSVVQA